MHRGLPENGHRIATAIALGIVGGVALVFLVSQILWSPLGTYVNHDRDGYAHYTLSQYSHHVGGNWGKFVEIYKGPNGDFFIQYPPLRYLIDHLFLYAFGACARSMYLANTFWWLALLCVSFLLGKQIGRSAIAGAAVCAIIAFHPDLAKLTYLVGLDLPQIVVVGLAVYLLFSLASNQWRYQPLLTGVAIGLAVLTKPTSVMFLIPCSLGLIFSKREVTWKPWRNLLIAWLVGGAVASLFYAPLLPELYQKALWQTTHEQSPAGGAVAFYSSVLLRLASLLEITLYASAMVFLAKRRDRWLIPLVVFGIGSIALHMPFFVRIEQIIYPAYFALALMLARFLGVASPNVRSVFRTVILPLSIVVLFSWNFWKVIYDAPDSQAIESRDGWPHLALRFSSPTSVPLYYFLEGDSPFAKDSVDEGAVILSGLADELRIAESNPPLLLGCRPDDFPELNISLVFAVGLLHPAMLAEATLFTQDQNFLLQAETDQFLNRMNDSRATLAFLPGDCRLNPKLLAKQCGITTEQEQQNIIINFSSFCQCTKALGRANRNNSTLFASKRTGQCVPPPH